MFKDLFGEIFEKNNDFSLGKIILMFYVLVSSSALFPLLSKQLKKKLEHDRISQHIVAILTMLSLTILVSNGKFCIQRIFIYTALGYLLFIFSTKMDIHFTIMTVGLLLGFYLYQNQIQNETEEIEKDKNISNENKNKLKKKKKDSYLYLFSAIAIMIVGGTLLYSNKKEVQYGGGYSLVNYLLH
jgi:Ca2+/Na+ antiporter